MFLGNDSKPDMSTFFEFRNEYDDSQEDVEIRSRSISSASHTSIPGFIQNNKGQKKYLNLAALDGFAMFEKDEEEEKEKVNDTVLKGMDVDSI